MLFPTSQRAPVTNHLQVHLTRISLCNSPFRPSIPLRSAAAPARRTGKFFGPDGVSSSDESQLRHEMAAEALRLRPLPHDQAFNGTNEYLRMQLSTKARGVMTRGDRVVLHFIPGRWPTQRADISTQRSSSLAVHVSVYFRI